jgi:predicted  nucleic acid-binding Zn-ribbon protein
LIAEALGKEGLPESLERAAPSNWQSWFAATVPSFDDPRMVSLLAAVETVCGRPLAIVARAIAARDAENARLRSLSKSQDEALTAAEADNIKLVHDARIQAEKLSERDGQISSLTAKLSELNASYIALRNDKDALVARTEELDLRAHAADEEAKSLRAALSTSEEALRQLQEAKQSTDRELEDARNGLTAALRQQKSLQGQIEADDQTIRHIMTQREELLTERERLEKERGKLTHQLSDTETRLSDSELKRETYVTALVERKREIDALSDKLAASSAAATEASSQAFALKARVQNWGHVPWRAIAAGSVAAGALLSAGSIFAWQAIESAIAPPAQVASSRPVVPDAEMDIGAAPDFETPVQKSEAKVAPDTLKVVDTTALEGSAPASPPTTETGVIPIPDESGTPAVNDQVQFNPEGLPPLDPDSRPPPQDLPPMQQKPKLLLKPKVPSSPEAP